jgi:hypothetical protein
MARTSAARRPTPVETEEPEAKGQKNLTWQQVRDGAELYWSDLGGRVVDQLIEWNRTLFEGAVRPMPIVLSRMSSVHGHWFCTLSPDTDQRKGFEQQLVTQMRVYNPPRAITSVRKVDLLRQLIRQLYIQDGKPPPNANSQERCDLIMRLHLALTGQRIFASPVYVEEVPQRHLGKGLYKPAETHTYQNNCPDTGVESLPLEQIKVWPHGLIDLGTITRGVT